MGMSLKNWDSLYLSLGHSKGDGKRYVREVIRLCDDGTCNHWQASQRRPSGRHGSNTRRDYTPFRLCFKLFSGEALLMLDFGNLFL